MKLFLARHIGYCLCLIMMALPELSWAIAAGELDTSFSVGNGPNITNDISILDVRGMALQPDGKLVVVGGFTEFNGVPRQHIVRLLADGSVDSSFDAGSAVNANVTEVAITPDGKILVAGGMLEWDTSGEPYGNGGRYVLRLHADGTRDNSFRVGFAGDSSRIVGGLIVQPDGKILVSGDFYCRLYRLNANGELDDSFLVNQQCYWYSNSVNAMAVQADGKLVIASDEGLLRLNSDGSQDVSFSQYVQLSGDAAFYQVFGDGNGSLYAVGSLENAGEPYPGMVFKFSASGEFQDNFFITVFDGWDGTGIEKILVQPDGKLIVARNFYCYGFGPTTGLMRFNADGSVDESFNSAIEDLKMVTDMEIQPDGRLVIVGEFTQYGGVAVNGVARVHTGDSDGDGIQDAADAFSLDPSETLDTDRDGIGNVADLDDDGDGVPDYIDADPLNPSVSIERPLLLDAEFRGAGVREGVEG